MVSSLGDLLERVSRPITVEDDGVYETIGVRWYGMGVFTKAPQKGSEIAAKTLFTVKQGDVVYSRLFAWKGSFGTVADQHDGAVASNEFPTYRACEALLPDYFAIWAGRNEVWDLAASLSSGTTSNSRFRLSEDDFLSLELDLPSVGEQHRVVDAASAVERLASALKSEAAAARDIANALYASEEWPLVPLDEVAKLDPHRVSVERDATYRIAGLIIGGGGLFWREAITGEQTTYATLHQLGTNQLVYRKLTAWEGPITVVPAEFDGACVSPEFPAFTLDVERLDPGFMRFICQRPTFHLQMRARATGTAERRNRLKPGDLLEIEVALPPRETQAAIGTAFGEALALEAEAREARALRPAIGRELIAA